jgi:protocatechuate 3,4-dioxygenase alpha subunit
MSPRQTPSQTIGPFFHYGLNPVEANYPHSQIAGHCLVSDKTLGEHIRVTGRVFDGKGAVIEDALLEIWQANAAGRYAHPGDARSNRALDPHFHGFGRCGTGANEQSRFAFSTIKPGAAQPGHAPFISVTVFMRGLLNHVYTRIYFDDEAAANAEDPVFSGVDSERQMTLLAKRCETPAGIEYRFDIHMQGDQETVFFDL